MEPCVIDWTATAAWVQAIGSIAAVGAAVWIGNRQHRQNVELVKSERERLEARDARHEHAVRDLAVKAVAMLEEPLDAMRNAHREALNFASEGRVREIEEAAQRLQESLLILVAHAGVVIHQFNELKEIYRATGPVQAVCHHHITSALSDIREAARSAGDILRRDFYGVVQFQVEALVKSIDEFHASIAEDLALL